MAIDPLEAVIALLRSDITVSGLVGGRIANKHRFGDPALGMWTRGQTAIAVRQEAGPGELYRPVHMVQVEVRCYAPTPMEGMAIWLAVEALTRTAERVVVQTANGQALLYSMAPVVAATQTLDEDVQMDVTLGVFAVMVFREAL